MTDTPAPEAPEKHCYDYSVIEYLPEPRTGEHINVGIAVSDDRTVHVRLADTRWRLTAADRKIQDEVLCSLTVGLLTHPPGSLQQLERRHGRGNMLHFRHPYPVAAESMERAAALLWDSFILPRPDVVCELCSAVRSFKPAAADPQHCHSIKYLDEAKYVNWHVLQAGCPLCEVRFKECLWEMGRNVAEKREQAILKAVLGHGRAT